MPWLPFFGIVAADDAELVGLPGQQRQMLGDADAGQRRRDGAELAADLGGGVGLGIEGVVMARAALHPQQDAADGLALGAAGRRRPRRLQAEEAGQRQTQGGQAADAEESAAGQAGAVGGAAGEQIEHGALPRKAG